MPNLAIGATNAPVPFHFEESHTVRAINLDGECWFVAADVCNALGLSNPTVSLNALDDDERAKKFLGRSENGGGGEVNIINESGLYALILRSRKPEAKRFRKWVTNEVLPAIRKTGGYIHQPAMRPQLTERQIAEIRCVMNDATKGWMDLNPAHIANHLRVIFSVENWHHIPAEHFETVKAIIASKDEARSQFSQFMLECRDWFEREVLAGGTPWTPAIKRKLTQRLKRQVILPPKVDWLALAEQVKKPLKGKKGGAA